VYTEIVYTLLKKQANNLLLFLNEYYKLYFKNKKSLKKTWKNKKYIYNVFIEIKG